jgi:hypothetical protein
MDFLHHIPENVAEDTKLLVLMSPVCIQISRTTWVQKQAISFEFILEGIPYPREDPG